MQLVTLDAQFEAETGAKLARVHVMLRNRIPQRPGDAHDRRPSSIALASPITRSTLDVARQLALRSGSILRLTVESRWCLLMALSGLSCGSDKRRLLTLSRHGYAQSPIHAANTPRSQQGLAFQSLRVVLIRSRRRCISLVYRRPISWQAYRLRRTS